MIKGIIMNSNQKLQNTKNVIQTDNNRRNFLKKSLYKAPMLVVLGQLIKPTSIYAESDVPPPPDDDW